MKLLRALILSLLISCTLTFAAATRIKYERDVNGVVSGGGTAFPVDLSEFGKTKPRYLLSAAHNVLDGYDEKAKPHDRLFIEFNGEWRKVRVVAADVASDVCLLEADFDLTELGLDKLSNVDVKLKGKVRSTGAKLFNPISENKGKLVRKFYGRSCAHLAELATDHGDSGAPVYDEKDLITGLVIAMPRTADGPDGDTRYCIYISVAVIRAFLEEAL